MERDELGREVRHVPPPGQVEPDLDDGAWPDPEHNQWTFEGEIERLGVLARGVNTRSRRSTAVRAAGWLVAIAMLLPIVIGLISVIAATWG